MLYDAVMAALADQIDAYCTHHGLLAHGATVVVAVSGGPDSLCLLHVLSQLAPRLSLHLHVAHLDHRLRPDSADDARFVAQLAVHMSLPFTGGHADIAGVARSTGTGIEATARAERYRFLISTAQATGADSIALGHTADDQAETVLLRLMRGAGPHGLAAMRPRRPADTLSPSADSSMTIIRPLLNTARSTVEAYCTRHNLTPRIDPTNSLPIHTRNRVRGYILPLLKTYNPSIVATLGRTARICAEEDDLLNKLTRQVWAEIAATDTKGVTLDRAGFVALHPALQRRVAQQAARVIAPDVELEARHIDLLLAAVAANRRRLQLPRGIWLDIGRRHLRLTIDEAPMATSVSREED